MVDSLLFFHLALAVSLSSHGNKIRSVHSCSDENKYSVIKDKTALCD